MYRILVVDDDPQIARLARSYFERAGDSVLVAADGETALHIIRAEKPDLVVLDLMLPGRDGWDITKIVRGDEKIAHTPIIMLTARVEDVDRIVGLELGADDYMSKPFNPRELVARARAVLRRAGAPQPKARALRAGEVELHPDARAVFLRGEPVSLTPSEFDILRALMENPMRAFTRMELIEKALGYTYTGMDRTLDSHIKNLRRKIEADPASPVYIETVYGVGYRWGM